MKKNILPGLRLTLITLVLFGVVYPLVVTGVAKIVGARGGEGKTVEMNGAVVGFDVIGQSFKSPGYFHGRPSAVGYNAAATGGSNKGPSNPEYLAQLEERISDLLNENPGRNRQDVPVDLVTASGGGLDPDISPRAARIQVARIAKARGIDPKRLEDLVSEHIEYSLFGPERVNVLRLNVALKQMVQSLKSKV